MVLFTLLSLLIVDSAFSSVKDGGMEGLMKQMLKYIRAERIQIESNQPALAFPVKQKQLKTAKVHGKKPSTEHVMYIDDFFARLNEYQQTKDSVQRRTTYNIMLNSCINCHRHECPGPVQVIQKSLF